MSSRIAKEHFDALVDLLCGMPRFATEHGRVTLLRMATTGLARGNDIRAGVNLGGEPRTAAVELVNRLAEFPAALSNLLDECSRTASIDDCHRLERIRTALGLSAAALAWHGSPYPGLLAFEPEQASIYFGREPETRKLLHMVVDEGYGLVTVIGASGTGKSSLVAAGLLPALAGDPRSAGWQQFRFVPGRTDDPFLSLALALEPRLGPLDLRAPDIAERLGANPDDLGRVLEDVGAATADAPAVLFVDQMEELFTQIASANPERVEPFLSMLAHAAWDGRVRVVATVRVDFLGEVLAHAALADRLPPGSLELGTPGPGSVYRMVTGPATAVHPALGFEDGLAERLFEDAQGAEGGLPLLALALQELYDRRDGATMTHAAYEAFEGLRGVVGRLADAAFAQLGEERAGMLAMVFRELVAVDDDGTPTRKRAPLARIAPDAASAAHRLVDAFSGKRTRLLVVGGDAEGVPTVEVAHEALFHAWAPLRAWIAERHTDLRLRQQVELDARRWAASGDAHALWPHERLQSVYAMYERLGVARDGLAEPVASFIRAEWERLAERLENPDLSHYDRADIGDRLARIGDGRRGVGLDAEGVPDIDWCEIPGGTVAVDGLGSFEVTPFEIARYPVTWAQYRAFLRADDGFLDGHWWTGLDRPERPGEQYRPLDNHPAEEVSWYDAVAFTRWLSTRLGAPGPVRLPFEWEWQLAATGGDAGREYPWGSWREGRANTSESRLGRTTAVGAYPHGASRQGVMDLAGNVAEWCLNAHDSPTPEEPRRPARCALRGGSWYFNQDHARASYRNDNEPDNRNNNIGFRVLRSSPIASSEL